MENKLIFFNTGWMDFYNGMSNDRLTGGGKHVKNEGWGGEIFNFQPYQNKVYGYVQPIIDKRYNNPSTIKLEKIGGLQSADRMDNVTVVWTAANPNSGGTYIIGWYKNATVFRTTQIPPKDANRKYSNNRLGFFATTKWEDAKLLPVDHRIIEVQRRRKNWMGQSNVWYADNNPEFVQIVKDYIFKGRMPFEMKSNGRAIQRDLLKRLEVEKNAIIAVTEHYQRLGYEIRSVEKDNVGWDLTATRKTISLKLEVKGLSGFEISTELTPNEYKNLRSDIRHYRLCIVTNALVEPIVKIFAYSNDKRKWASEDGTVLKFEEVVSARVFI